MENLTDSTDLIDRVEHLAAQPHAGIPSRGIVFIRIEPVRFSHAPPAVAAAGAEADRFCLEHRDIQIGFLLLQVVDSPETGKSCTDDGDLALLGQIGKLWFADVLEGIEPETHIAVWVGHLSGFPFF